MAKLASRLTSTGNLLTRGELNEVAGTTIRLTINNQYAAFLDEITLQGATDVARRETNTGTILISGYFDEVTLSPNIPTGQQAYTTPGTFYWTCPTGVYSVAVVAVGGGGGGGTGGNGAGGGGGLGWKNNIPVNPGQVYTVVVGAGGSGQSFYPPFTELPPTAGSDSYFINATTVKGGGASNTGAGGTYVGDGGGDGGTGYGSGFNQASGAGAGGYSGAGANGILWPGTFSPGLAGTGGSGGSGGLSQSGIYTAAGGGGVGILGQGADGAAGIGTYSSNSGGGGGSGGSDGDSYGTAGLYGGGGARAPGYNTSSGAGGKGAVRIIWGDDRSFPSTDTGDL